VKASESQISGLQKIVRRHTAGQQIVLRARIVLAALEGKSNAQIARELHVTLDTVRLWRKRWADLELINFEDLSVEERLEDLPRPGAPARITADQVCKISELACKKPEDSGRPITEWTAREIADEIKLRGIVEQISPRHAARLLKRCGC
jgi:transposase